MYIYAGITTPPSQMVPPPCGVGWRVSQQQSYMGSVSAAVSG
jgi:hypothetical protein